MMIAGGQLPAIVISIQYFFMRKLLHFNYFFVYLCKRNLKSNINLKTNDYEKIILCVVGVAIFVGSV